MKLRKGNVLEHTNECNYLLVTTNAIIKKNGAVVMGAGFAKTIRDGVPGLDAHLGELIKGSTDPKRYGLVLSDYYGAFQVKYHYKDSANLELLRYSAESLAFVASRMPTKTFFINYPGIGNGKLTVEQVGPLLTCLPDNVHVWMFK